MELNLDICRLITQLKCTPDSIPLSCKIELGNQWNSFVLCPPSNLYPELDLDDINNSCYVKQHMDKWEELRNEACVTGSTLGKAIGLDTLKAQKIYYQEKFKNKKATPITPELKKCLEYGSQNEVNVYFEYCSMSANFKGF